MNTNIMKLDINEMALVSGGRKKFSRFGQPLKEILMNIVCHGHDWQPTGEKRTSNYLSLPLPMPFSFLEYEEHQYMCSRCHSVEWRK